MITMQTVANPLNNRETDHEVTETKKIVLSELTNGTSHRFWPINFEKSKFKMYLGNCIGNIARSDIFNNNNNALYFKHDKCT